MTRYVTVEDEHNMFNFDCNKFIISINGFPDEQNNEFDDALASEFIYNNREHIGENSLTPQDFVEYLSSKGYQSKILDGEYFPIWF